MSRLHEGQRTYTVGFSGIGVADDVEHLDVPFVDSAGNVIKCNYIKVEANGKFTGYTAIMCHPSGVEGQSFVDLTQSSVVAATDLPLASCNVGFGLLATYSGNGTGTWHGSNGEIATGLRMLFHSNKDNFISLVVTYGNLYPFNPIALDSYDKGV